MVHGLDRGCPAVPRHPYERYEVHCQEGKRQRSAGIFPTKRRAEAERRAIERGRPELVAPAEVDLERARALFGEYVATKWCPAWKDQHPKRRRRRRLPGPLPPGAQERAGRTAAARNQPVPRREVWLVREQLDRLVAAIDSRYRALVLVAALTGMRWGELVALRWDDPRFDQPLDDGAVRGPGRLRIARAISDPRRTGRGVEKGPKTGATVPAGLREPPGLVKIAVKGPPPTSSRWVSNACGIPMRPG
jgi:integrase